MKKSICYIMLFTFVFLLLICPKCFAADLDEIVNYEVIVEPRMNDGTLDITYQITWKVLDSSTEGPLEWVQIGTPNASLLYFTLILIFSPLSILVLVHTK